MSRCDGARGDLRRAFVGRGLPRGGADRLWAHLRECAACRARYDALATMSRDYAGQGPDAPAPWELALLQARALPAARRRRAARPLGVLVIATAAAALLLWWQGPRDGAWQARTAAAPPVSVRALCSLIDLGGQPLVRSWTDHPGPDEVDTCPRDGAARLAYRATTGGLLYVGTGSDGATVAWHGVDAPAEITPIERLTLLPVDLTPALARTVARLEVVTVFSGAPLTTCMLDASVGLGPCSRPEGITLTRQVLAVGPGNEDPK